MIVSRLIWVFVAGIILTTGFIGMFIQFIYTYSQNHKDRWDEPKPGKRPDVDHVFTPKRSP